MFTTRPELTGTFGMVASTHWLASAAGMSILESGGNAFDAAAAAGFVLQVVEPHLNGPGGEVPILLYSLSEDRVVVINGQGTAPSAASIDHFASLGLDLVPGTGLLPACVPGAFGAWMRLLADHGTMRLAEVLSFAIGYAHDGYPVLPGITSAVQEVEELFRHHWTDSAHTYLAGGRPPEPGSRFRNRQLAATYLRVIAEAEAVSSDRDEQIEVARRVWYEGFVAAAIDDYIAGARVLDSSGRAHRGLLTGEDLVQWRATSELPVVFDYGEHTVCKTGPWGQGPVFLQQLALLSGFDLAAMGRNSADFIHTVVECAKLAFADREAYYGDPDFVDVPVAELLDESYNKARRHLVDATASLELLHGTVAGYPARLPEPSRAGGRNTGSGEPTMGGSGDTCHVDVVDRHGNMVAATPSGGWLSSSPMIPTLGFPLGTRGQMFWLEPGLPNSLAPGKRPRTTLSPTLVLRGSEPYMAFGTPGGDQQDQWTLLFFLNHVHFGLNLQAAIDAPMWHSEHFPSSFWPRESTPGHLALENRIDSSVVDDLERRGHRVDVRPPWSLGRVSAVAREPGAGFLKAAANPRGMQGYAAGR